MFVSGKPFQPSLMFADKAGAYPSEETFRCSILRLEKLARDKHTSLSRKSVNYVRNKFYTTRPDGLDKLFTAVIFAVS